MERGLCNVGDADNIAFKDNHWGIRPILKLDVVEVACHDGAFIVKLEASDGARGTACGIPEFPKELLLTVEAPWLYIYLRWTRDDGKYDGALGVENLKAVSFDYTVSRVCQASSNPLRTPM